MFKAKNRAPKSVAEKHIPKRAKKLRKNTNLPMPRKNPQRDLVMVLAIQPSLSQHSTASSLLMVIMNMITMMIPLRPMIKQLTT
jgi:hypothetical protein